MIELMLYRYGDLPLFVGYLFFLIYISTSIFKSYESKLRIRIAERRDEFKSSVELTINDVLWRSISTGKLTYRDEQEIGFKIMNFDWR